MQREVENGNVHYVILDEVQYSGRRAGLYAHTVMGPHRQGSARVER